MTLVVDTGPLVALADRHDPAREAVRRVLAEEPGQLVVPAPVTAEADYLLGRRHGDRARRAFLEDLAAERFAVLCLEPEDHALALEVDSRYAELGLGLADCSLVVAAHRRGTDRLLSFDERDLRAVAPISGGSFTLLPADG